MRKGLGAVEFSYDAMTGAFTENDHPSLFNEPHDTSPWPKLSVPAGPVTAIDTHTGATATMFGEPFAFDNPFAESGPLWGDGTPDMTNLGRYAIYAGVGVLALWLLLRK